MIRFPRLGLALALLLVLGGEAAPSSAHYIDLRGKLVEEGALSFGIALVGRPFSYREEGSLKGFEVDLAAAVTRSRGLELRLVKLPRDRLLEALRTGEVDMINSLALRPAPAVGLAVLPYLVVGDYMMVLKGNPFRISDAMSLAGHTVAATAGSSAERFAIELNNELRAAGAAPMHIHSFPYQRDAHFPVSMGHAAAYFVQSISAVGPTNDPDSRVRLMEGVFRPRGEAGFATRMEARDLADAIEHAIAAQVATGEYERIRLRHGLPRDMSPFK